jgi:hypothetical protein|nr:MAG TPA: tail protein [Caudoviricetes sp.]
MAILSNGKFSGFLCSIRDTGKKLKDGAAVMVEDFLSGFNGYGWKLWKKSNLWRLEIDELLVRKSFTTFEHIISQITSIRGGQTISQGHAKIKAVTIIEADVYRETDGEETITQEQCYRLEIDDESNSIVEYDFVQCLKGNRQYLVQVGSVFQYYINIPITEFDSDAETGEVLNAPQAGDEIVQFGNASHQDKYKNRHSALYLHVDEDEPAIDLMTDIYSKDWSNAIKVRIGGNLPGTDGDRGFYSVNGKIISVDENNDIVYEINPDGSGYFARGKFSWTKDGSPKFSGTILLQIDKNNVWEVTEAGENIIGNKDGKRIVISPVSQDIKVFDDSNNNVLSIEGSNRNDISDFFGGTPPTITIKNIPFSIVATVTRAEMTVSEGFYTNTLMNLSVEFNYNYSQYSESSASGNISGTLYLDNFSDYSYSNYQNSSVIASFNVNVTGTGTFVVRNTTTIEKGYHTLRFLILKDRSVTSFSISSLNVEFVIDSYLASLFANGIVLGSSTNNLFYAINKQPNPSLNIKNLFFGVMNDFSGLKIDTSGSYSKINGHWGLLPSLIAYGVVWGGNTPTYKAIKTFDGSSFPAATRIGEGVYRINFPTSWKSLNISATNAYIMLTGIGFSLASGATDAPIKATLKGWVTNGFDVWLSDDETVNDGDFAFELKWLG